MPEEPPKRLPTEVRAPAPSAAVVSLCVPTRDEMGWPATASVKVMMLNPIAVATSPASAPERSTRRLVDGESPLKKAGTARNRSNKPAERPPRGSGGGSGFGSAFGRPGTRTCRVERRPPTVLGRSESVLRARSIWACKMAEMRVIAIAVSAVPIKVPATPSLDVKRAVTTEASPAANALFISTSFAVCCRCSVITPPSVAVCS